MDFEHAKLLQERGQLDDAIKIYDQILNQNFHQADVLFYYGTAALQKGQNGLAANLLKSALDIDPRQDAIFQNLGSCFRAENKVKEAEDIYRLGLKIKETAPLWANIGSLYVNNGTPEQALKAYRRAKELDPDDKQIDFNMSLPLLELGRWEEGWKLYEAGFQAGIRKDRTYGSLPKWDGSPGKTVIVWGEQGIGDEIMFASCIPDLMKVSKRVIFDCHPRLVKTFERAFGIECHGTRKTQYLDWLDKSDAHATVCVSTLASFFRKKDSDFPGKPFIHTPTRPRKPGKLRVGIAWTGGTKLTRKDLRSIKLDALLPILKQDCEFYSLQYTPESAREVCELEEQHGVHIKHFPNYVECRDYDVTMNFIASMDIVITVCTAVVHAAGSQGVPCWVLVPSRPAWRYLTKGERMPWYNSVRLFRQPGDDWTPVINDISEELDAHIRSVSGLKHQAA